MPDLGAWTYAALAAAALLGAVVQSTVGIGLALLAAPIMTLVAPQLMPGSMLIVVVVLPILTLAGDHEDIDWRGLAWTFPTRAVGTAGGVALVVLADRRQLGLVIGVAILLAVLLTWRTVVVPITRLSLATVGLVSGITGTISSIGGPPMALLYQRRAPQQIRSTLAVYFMVGALMSLTGLVLANAVTRDQVLVAVTLVPVLILSTQASRRLRRWLPAERVRPVVLVICAASSGVLIVRSLLG